MTTIKVIDKLKLVKRYNPFIDKETLTLSSKSKNGRTYYNAHYRQGDLDGACGAYSIAMCLNILGVFNSEESLSKDDSKIDWRTLEGRMIKKLDSKGLYRNGLELEECEEILDTYKSMVYYEEPENDEDIIAYAKKMVDENTPSMLGISFSGGAHWIVIVGYVIDDKTNTFIALLTLDPGYKSQSVAFWNGYISLKIENNNKRKTYKYFYAPMNRLISINEIFSIHIN